MKNITIIFPDLELTDNEKAKMARYAKKQKNLKKALVWIAAFVVVAFIVTLIAGWFRLTELQTISLLSLPIGFISFFVVLGETNL